MGHPAGMLLVVVSLGNVILPKKSPGEIHSISETGFPLDSVPIVISNHDPNKKIVSFSGQVSGAFKIRIYDVCAFHHDRRAIGEGHELHFLRWNLLPRQYLHMRLDAFYPCWRKPLIAEVQSQHEIGLGITFFRTTRMDSATKLLKIGEYPSPIPVHLSVSGAPSLDRLFSDNKHGQEKSPNCYAVRPPEEYITTSPPDFLIIFGLCGIAFAV